MTARNLWFVRRGINQRDFGTGITGDLVGTDPSDCGRSAYQSLLAFVFRSPPEAEHFVAPQDVLRDLFHEME